MVNIIDDILIEAMMLSQEKSDTYTDDCYVSLFFHFC